MRRVLQIVAGTAGVCVFLAALFYVLMHTPVP